MQSGAEGKIKELGKFHPELKPASELKTGEIGYLATGIKDSGKVRVGDTLIKNPNDVEALPGYKEPQPVIFASLYPKNSQQYGNLKDALGKLKLADPAFTFEPESKDSLGRGIPLRFSGFFARRNYF